jgi:membrane fusion protein (multidrug efflux system)
MSAFSRTTRSLGEDGLAGLRALLWLVLLTLTGLAAWASLARVVVLESTANARLEVVGAAHALVAEVDGQVEEVRLHVGDAVARGQVVLALDATAAAQLLAQERSKADSLNRQRDSLRAQLEASGRALQHGAEEQKSAEKELRGKLALAQAEAALQERELAGVRGLKGNKLVSDLELLRAETEAKKKASEAEALGLQLNRMAAAEQRAQSEKEAALEALRRELARLDGEALAAQEAQQRLASEVARRSVRAPVAGRIAELAALQPGAYLRAGDKVGAVLPEGQLQIVAWFPPAVALGRITAGQRAQLRLSGFAWAEYGTVPAAVTRVSSEVRDGLVRVELALAGKADPRVPLQHGLPGTLEVEVERAAPLALLLRAAGGSLGAAPPAAQPAAAPAAGPAR